MTRAPRIEPNAAQIVKDYSALAGFCAECGLPQDGSDRLVLAASGYRVHRSHIFDPANGYFGQPHREEP